MLFTPVKYIRALQCAMRGCLKKATALRPNAISFLLQCGTKLPKLVLVLACFFLSCNPGAISLSRVAFHMESENTPFRLSLVLRHKSILCCLPQSSFQLTLVFGIFICRYPFNHHLESFSR